MRPNGYRGPAGPTGWPHVWLQAESPEVSSSSLQVLGQQCLASGRGHSRDCQDTAPLSQSLRFLTMSGWPLRPSGYLPGHQTSCGPGLPAQNASQQPTGGAGAFQSLETTGRAVAVQPGRAACQLWKGDAGHRHGCPRVSPHPQGQESSGGRPEHRSRVADSKLKAPRKRGQPSLPYPSGPAGGSGALSGKSCKSRPGRGAQVAPGSLGWDPGSGRVLL